MGLEAAGHVLGSVVGEHGSDLDPVTTVEPEDVVDEAHGVGMGDRSEHDHDDGPAGEDVDGSELVHLAHPLQLPDVEAVQADELARTPGGQAEPEELLVPGCVGQEAGGGAVMAAARARRWDRFPRPWATRCFWTVDLAMENPWSPRRSAYWRQPMVGSTTARVSRDWTT